MPNAPLPALAAVPDLAGRLKLPVPTDPLVVQEWEDALLDASSALRDAIGQPLTPATSTIPVSINLYGFGLIPICPVTAVTAVADPTGFALPTDGTGWTVEGQRLTIYSPYLIGNPRALVDPVYLVTINHGWDPMPGELLRWTYVLAAAQLANVEVGSLGVNGGASQVGIDDGSVKYSDISGMIPERVQARMRAMYGGEQ